MKSQLEVKVKEEHKNAQKKSHEADSAKHKAKKYKSKAKHHEESLRRHHEKDLKYMEHNLALAREQAQKQQANMGNMMMDMQNHNQNSPELQQILLQNEKMRQEDQVQMKLHAKAIEDLDKVMKLIAQEKAMKDRTTTPRSQSTSTSSQNWTQSGDPQSHIGAGITQQSALNQASNLNWENGLH